MSSCPLKAGRTSYAGFMMIWQLRSAACGPKQLAPQAIHLWSADLTRQLVRVTDRVSRMGSPITRVAWSCVLQSGLPSWYSVLSPIAQTSPLLLSMAENSYPDLTSTMVGAGLTSNLIAKGTAVVQLPTLPCR
jgi:hypothetical protein